MKRCTILAVLAALVFFGFAQPVSAQVVPSIQGLKAFSMQARYMSEAGYLRWQYFMANDVWISQEEAGELVRLQMRTTN